jgi:hypothetical protein
MRKRVGDLYAGRPRDCDIRLRRTRRGGDDDHPTRGAGAMASRGLSPLLALEISKPGRPATNRCGSAGIDPADLIDELDPKVFATSSITGIAGCCAGAVSGHAIAPPSSVMKSRGITAVAALTARAAGVRRHEMRTYQFVLVGRKAAAAQITRPISIRREDRHDAIRRIPRVRRRF